MASRLTFLKAFVLINESVARWYTAYIYHLQRSYERV